MGIISILMSDSLWIEFLLQQSWCLPLSHIHFVENSFTLFVVGNGMILWGSSGHTGRRFVLVDWSTLFIQLKTAWVYECVALEENLRRSFLLFALNWSRYLVCCSCKKKVILLLYKNISLVNLKKTNGSGFIPKWCLYFVQFFSLFELNCKKMLIFV